MRTYLGSTALLLALAAPPVVAQQPAAAGKAKPPVEKAKPEAAKAADAANTKLAHDPDLAQHFKDIDLTDDQAKRISDIKARHHKAMEAIKKDAKDPNDEAAKVKIQRHMDAEHAEFKAVLSEEQARKFEEKMQKEHKSEASRMHAKDAMAHEKQSHEKDATSEMKHQSKHTEPKAARKPQ